MEIYKMSIVKQIDYCSDAERKEHRKLMIEKGYEDAGLVCRCGSENGKFVRTPCGKYIKYIPIPVVKKFNNNIKINNNKHYKQPK